MLRFASLCAVVGSITIVVLIARRRWPEGLRLFRGVFSLAEAAELVKEVVKLEACLRSEFEDKGHRLERRNRSYSRIPPAFAERSQSRVTLQFGAYTSNNRVQRTERVDPLPAFLKAVAKKLKDRGIFNEEPDTCCVNIYEAGQWIPLHVDNPSFDRPFATLSLESEQFCDFSHDGKLLHISLPVGSVLRLDGPAANVWRHGIPPVSQRRISLTFRRLRFETASIHDASRKDTAARRDAKAALKRAKKAAHREAKKVKKNQVKSSPVSVDVTTDNNGVVPKIERDHVWAVYDAIAPQWHGTRYKAWPRVDSFARSVHGIVGDVGCGNGKNATAICDNGTICLACDVAVNLLKIALRDVREKSTGVYECFAADACKLPWRSNFLDACLIIAVLHHISTLERRILVIAEAFRCLRVGGEALVYAWALDQREDESRSGHRFASSDVLVPFHLRQHGEYWHETSQDTFIKETQGPIPDHAELDSSKQALVLQRYCHVFAQGELESLLLSAVEPGSIRIDESYYDAGNWAVRATKLC